LSDVVVVNVVYVVYVVYVVVVVVVVVVNTSLTEAFCMAIVTAIACGLTVVGTKV
jgi:hypothetical protein